MIKYFYLDFYNKGHVVVCYTHKNNRICSIENIYFEIVNLTVNNSFYKTIHSGYNNALLR